MRVAEELVRFPVGFLAGGGAVLSDTTTGAFLQVSCAIADGAA